MKFRSRLFLLLSIAGFAMAVQAQTPTAGAPRKIAITSLVGDQLGIAAARDRVGTSIATNAVNHMKMPGPMLDHTLMRVAEDALLRMTPKPVVASLRVPAAGSALDPAQLVVDGKVATGNALIEALKQQAFTHLLIATKHRARNSVRLGQGVVVGVGQLEGLGFYLDYGIHTQRSDTTANRSQGLIAPYVYIQFALIDLAAMEVRSTEIVTVSGVYTPGDNPNNALDPWEAMTAEQKLGALNGLLERHVPPAVAALAQAR